MQAPQRGDMEQRPLIVVAERSETAEEGPRLMDFAVACYRLRWPFLLVWVSTVVVSLVWMPLSSKDRFTWTFVVSVTDESRSSGQSVDLQPLMTQFVARIEETGGAARDVELDYLKLGSGSKAELIRRGIVVRGTGNSADGPPESLQGLRRMAEAWIGRETLQWAEEQSDLIDTLRRSRDVIASEVSAGGSLARELAASELALAKAEVALHFPPKYAFSAMHVSDRSSTFFKEMIRRSLSCGAMAVVVVGCWVGWSRLRQAAASR